MIEKRQYVEISDALFYQQGFRNIAVAEYIAINGIELHNIAVYLRNVHNTYSERIIELISTTRRYPCHEPI